MLSGEQYVTSRYAAPGFATMFEGGCAGALARGNCDDDAVAAGVDASARVGDGGTFCPAREQAAREMMMKMSDKLRNDFIRTVSFDSSRIFANPR
jgi:hypothetical protein